MAASDKNGELSAFESTLERDLLTIQEFDINVERYDVQPVTIKYLGVDGRRLSYTPDLLVHYRRDILPGKTMKHLLCEVKYREDLRANWTEYKGKFRAAIRYARERGWEFRVLTEREIRTPYLENAKFLLEYRSLDYAHPFANLLRQTLFELRVTDPEGLLAAIYNDKWQRASLLPYLWRLVVARLIGVDLTTPLTMRSTIWTVDSYAPAIEG